MVAVPNVWHVVDNGQTHVRSIHFLFHHQCTGGIKKYICFVQANDLVILGSVGLKRQVHGARKLRHEHLGQLNLLMNVDHAVSLPHRLGANPYNNHDEHRN